MKKTLFILLFIPFISFSQGIKFSSLPTTSPDSSSYIVGIKNVGGNFVNYKFSFNDFGGGGGGINQVLINGNTTNNNYKFGITNPFSAYQYANSLSVNSTDSAAMLIFKDSLNPSHGVTDTFSAKGFNAGSSSIYGINFTFNGMAGMSLYAPSGNPTQSFGDAQKRFNHTDIEVVDAFNRVQCYGINDGSGGYGRDLFFDGVGYNYSIGDYDGIYGGVILNINSLRPTISGGSVPNIGNDSLTTFYDLDTAEAGLTTRLSGGIGGNVYWNDTNGVTGSGVVFMYNDILSANNVTVVVHGYLDASAVSTATLAYKIDYTDIYNASQTAVVIGGVVGATDNSGEQTIRAKGGTAVAVYLSKPTGTATYVCGVKMEWH